MGRFSHSLVAALLLSALTFLAPAVANAGSVAAVGGFAEPFEAAADLFQPAGYYGGYHHNKSYDDNDDYEGEGHSYKYKKHYKNDDYYTHRRGNHCGRSRYHQKYVCEQNEPRCFKQRECIWYYGREYCRYVRKCNGGEKYCKWVDVPYYNNYCN